MSFWQRHLPAWIAHYPRDRLATDLVAGLVVGILVIPQSLAYALLAGLPPQAGLYAGIFPVLVYAWIGSSMTQAVGPVAITAIMTFSVLSPLAAPASPHYLELAAWLALLSGLMVLAFGLLRLGFLAQLLSRPVVSGFISGSAVLIVLSQIKPLLGLTGSGRLGTLRDLLNLSLSQVNPLTLLIAALSLLILLFSRRSLPRLLVRAGLSDTTAGFAGRLVPLVVIAVATFAVVRLDLDLKHGVAVVGHVEQSAAAFALQLPSAGTFKELLVPAALLALIGMVQNISMAQALAVKRRERIDANRELIGLGSANLVATFSGGMPVGGGVSRSAINVAAGAQSPLASIVSALILLSIVLAGTDWLARLPLAVLAANIMVAALAMIDVKTLRQAWAYDRADALALLGTALGVMILGLEAGITLGIGLSLATLVLRASTPHIAVIGRIPGSEHFRNVERHGVETIPGALFLRIDESLFFGNLAAVESRLFAELEHAPATRDVVLIMSAVNRVDTTAAETLHDLNRELSDRGIRLHLAEVKGPVQDRLVQAPLWRDLSGEVFLSVNQAFERLAGERAQPDATELPPPKA